jgi:hypothetical protein
MDVQHRRIYLRAAVFVVLFLLHGGLVFVFLRENPAYRGRLPMGRYPRDAVRDIRCSVLHFEAHREYSSQKSGRNAWNRRTTAGAVAQEGRRLFSGHFGWWR